MKLQESDFAIDVYNQEIIQLPKELGLSFDSLDNPPFWIVFLERIPYGLDTRSGQVIVCGRYKNDFKFKAWRFWDSDNSQYSAWKKAPEPCYDLNFLSYFKVQAPIRQDCSSLWQPPTENSWQADGRVSYSRLRSGEWVKNEEGNQTFSKFMEINYFHLLELLPVLRATAQ